MQQTGNLAVSARLELHAFNNQIFKIILLADNLKRTVQQQAGGSQVTNEIVEALQIAAQDAADSGAAIVTMLREE